MATDRGMRYWSLLLRKAEQWCNARRVGREKRVSALGTRLTDFREGARQVLNCQGWEQGLHLQGVRKPMPLSTDREGNLSCLSYPQCALQGEQLELWRKARCSLMKELSPSLLPLLLLAVQGTYSYSVWGAQWVLPFPCHGGQAGTKHSGVKWHLCPRCHLLPARWHTCQSGHPVLQSHGAGLAVGLGLSSEGCTTSSGSLYIYLGAAFVLTQHLLAMMTSFTSHSYLMSSG